MTKKKVQEKKEVQMIISKETSLKK